MSILRHPLHTVADNDDDDDKTKSAYNDIIVDDISQEVLDVKSMLFKLKTILLEVNTTTITTTTKTTAQKSLYCI